MGKILAISALALNVVLAILLYQARQDPANKDELREGMRVPSFIGRNLEGAARPVEYPAGATTVLYVFSPACGWCAQDLKSVAKLSRELPQKTRFFAVSLEREGQFEWVQLKHPDYEIITDLPYRVYQSYRLSATPLTAVISSSGVVERVWRGAFSGQTLRSIEQYFGVSLPQAALIIRDRAAAAPPRRMRRPGLCTCGPVSRNAAAA